MQAWRAGIDGVMESMARHAPIASRSGARGVDVSAEGVAGTQGWMSRCQPIFTAVPLTATIIIPFASPSTS